MSSPAGANSRQVRTRAKQACLHCNQRRIRCNVLQERPCQNCVALNVPCEIGVSKRGKYPRKKTPGKLSTPRKDGSGPSISETPSADHPHTPSATSTLQRSLHLKSHDSPLTGQPRVNPYIPGDPAVSHQTVFLGESSPLTVVIDEGHT
ncbi:hypothetical protein BO71DRAFT_398818 [Aspergillus ellipticus CBS 707.79]|uniref:Zn(2)-C6 fungal-type domain-containing protein n=1 Tax=Aspergillus ellipticus CBS 707.79 TaxID=1448320 RepID=A0A319ETP3_9EURO|nr:hypothetical protein BO71DRAFT_398818 [Aspergillus ellipticus CBS 707.79]